MTHPLDQKALEAAELEARTCSALCCKQPDCNGFFCRAAITAYLQETGDGWQGVDEVETQDGFEAWGYEPDGEPQFVAVVWLVFEDVGRWMYQDEALQDICPEGADVTHVRPLPSPPGGEGT